ncbi:MAG TPA: hypothetical protein PKV27_05930, partial [Ilumatobacteraceae bacterium]|nr:hypothetical protein [Ilumatobacteraceae bacterium]
MSDIIRECVKDLKVIRSSVTSEWKELGVNDDRDTAGRSSIEQLLAYEQIRQLASRYAVTLNHRDLDALA